MLPRDFPKSVMCGIAERIGKPFSHVQEPFRSQSVHVKWLRQDTCMDGCISNPLKWLRPRNLTLSCANMVSSIQCLGCLPTFLDELRTCTGTKLRIVQFLVVNRGSARPLLLLAVYVWVCCEWRKGWWSRVHQNADPWPVEAASESCERGCCGEKTSNAWFKVEQDSKASATRFGVMQFDVACRRWKRCDRRCFSWKLLERRHQWSLGSLATAVESNDHDVFCLRFHTTAWMGDVHGTRWKRTRTRRRRWTRARARTSSRTTHIQIPNEQEIIRSHLCKCDQWSNVQSWRDVGMDVSSMRSTSTKEHQSRCQCVSHGDLTTVDTSVLLLWRDERQWVPKHDGQCGCDDGLDRWRKLSSSSDVNGWKRNRDLSSFSSLPSWFGLGEPDSQCRGSTKRKCKCRWNYNKCRDEFRVFWIRKPSRATEKVFAHTARRSFWPRTLDGDTPWRRWKRKWEWNLRQRRPAVG